METAKTKNEIVKWTPKVRIWYWDVGNAENYVIVDEDKRDVIENLLNSWKIVNIEGISIQKSRYIKTEPLEHIRDNVQRFLLLQKPFIREILKEREKEKREKINKGFESVQEILFYLEKKGYAEDAQR